MGRVNDAAETYERFLEEWRELRPDRQLLGGANPTLQLIIRSIVNPGLFRKSSPLSVSMNESMARITYPGELIPVWGEFSKGQGNLFWDLICAHRLVLDDPTRSHPYLSGLGDALCKLGSVAGFTAVAKKQKMLIPCAGREFHMESEYGRLVSHGWTTTSGNGPQHTEINIWLPENIQFYPAEFRGELLEISGAVFSCIASGSEF